MKYLLVLGLYCNVYRKEPQIRFFFKDQLVDEFNVKHHPDIDNISTHKDILKPKGKKLQLESYLIKSLPLLRVYEIDIIDSIDQAQIRIDIENNDNNYTNGFVNKSTFLCFREFLLLPKDPSLYRRFLYSARKRLNSVNYAWYRRDNYFFDLTTCSTWIGNNGQTIKYRKLRYYTIGGSGTLSCQLYKKYKILIPLVHRPYQYTMDNVMYDYIYNKYYQYANHRNPD